MYGVCHKLHDACCMVYAVTPDAACMLHLARSHGFHRSSKSVFDVPRHARARNPSRSHTRTYSPPPCPDHTPRLQSGCVTTHPVFGWRRSLPQHRMKPQCIFFAVVPTCVCCGSDSFSFERTSCVRQTAGRGCARYRAAGGGRAVRRFRGL